MNSYILAPRSVTLAPTGLPSRILNAATDFFARRMTGFWPVMAAMSSIAASRILMFVDASPTPMLTMTFCILGAAQTFSMDRSFMSCGSSVSV